MVNYMIKFNLIGAGRLGSSVTFALTREGNCQLQAIYQRDGIHAKQFIAALGHGQVFQKLDALPYAPLTVITTPDDVLPTIVKKLASDKKLRSEQTLESLKKSIVIHMSGSLSSEVLSPLRDKGYSVASFHPLKAFAERSLENKPYVFKDCDVVYEGDEDAIAFMLPLFEKLGAHFTRVTPELKILYHAGAVMASNYLVTLAAQGIGLMTQAGIDAGIAHKMVARLMQTSLDNVREQPMLEQALTGPLARGDLDVIARHLQAIDNPVTRQLYSSQLLATLPLTRLDETKCDFLKKWIEEI